MSGRTALAVLSLCCLTAPREVAAQSPAVEGSGWTVTRLDLDVTVGHTAEQLRFSGRARLRLDADSSTGPALSLNSRVAALWYTRLESAGASSTLNGTVPADSAIRLARLRFEKPRRRGAEIEVEVAYEARAQSSQLISTAQVALASWVENWYPTPVTADGYTAAAASASGTTRFHLPRGWRAVSSGREGPRQVTPTGVTNTWIVEQPVARSFAAGPYVVSSKASGSRQIALYLLSASSATAGRQARTLDRALRAMELKFGPYPYPAYSIAELPENAVSWAASSEQGFIMAKTSMFAVPGGNLPLFAHEAAHGWWGNAVTTSGPGAKLGSEALAQYGAVIAIEALEGRAAAREFLRFSRTGYNPLQCALGYFYIWREGGDKPLSELASDQWDHNLADSKGMWFYHMARQRMGDEVFFGALRQLLASHTRRPMSLGDIRAAFLAAAPADTGLAAFLSQWLDGKGAPVLDVDWWSSRRPPASAGGEPGFGATVRARQRQQEEPFALVLEVALKLRDSTTVIDTLQVDQRDQTFELNLPERPLDLVVDPFHRMLIWRPEYGPRPPGSE